MAQLARIAPTPTQVSPALIAEHEALIRRIARKVHRSASSAIDLEELVQTGMLALVQAAQAFVPRGDASFAVYAAMRARGAMIDVLRASATINRGAMRRRRKLKETEAALEGRLGRAPSSAEMAKELGVSAAEHRAAVDTAQPVYLEPLDAVYNDRSSAFACAEPDAFDRLEASALRAALATEITKLPHREALVLQLYFVEELTLDEIGRTLDVGAARVCQIKKQGLDRLRARLGPQWS